MRILVAIDNSTASHRAAELVGNVQWPARSTTRIVVVDEGTVAIDAAPWLGEPIVEGRGPSWEHRRVLAVAARAAERVIAASGLAVETTTRDGWAAEEIVREARDWRADLVVVGSHGHSVIGSALLGSVSATVVDRAPCPVLVARTVTVDRIVLGVDLAAWSDAAVSYIDRHDLFPAARIEVVGAAQARVPVGAVPPEIAADGELYAYRLAEARSRERLAVAAAAKRLAHGDRHLAETVRDGPAAITLVDLANARDADLIVVGTRGETGFRRLLHGSVAHDVLLSAHCSVLVVHEMSAERADEPSTRSAVTLV